MSALRIVHGVYSSNLAGTYMYKRLFGKVLVLRRNNVVSTFQKVYSACLQACVENTSPKRTVYLVVPSSLPLQFFLKVISFFVV